MNELRLSDLIQGDIVRILADQPVEGLDDDGAEVDNTTEYFFEVLEPGDKPRCNFAHRLRGGNYFAGPVRVRLLGSGDDTPIPGETAYERELRLESIEGAGPCPTADGILRAGRTILILDDRDVELPIGRVWHELVPEIVGLVVTREPLPVAAE